VVEDRVLGEVLDDPRPGVPAGDAGRDHRLAEGLERARHVDALAPGHRRLLDRTVTVAEPEVRHGKGPVHGRIERDGDDHAPVVRLLLVLRTARTRSATSIVATRMARITITVKAMPSIAVSRWTVPAPGISAAVTSGRRRTTSPRYTTATVPTRSPAGSGPSSSSGTSSTVRASSPRRTVSATSSVVTSAASASSNQRTG